ncbi:MAG: GlsB/YeaQ/YmgE family stress response membrane protein [Pseudomonadota bacterium]|nr:GlsB/YeaQ/YmgE family stress response membrane protein [Pseudomonadota bacterium]
MLSLIGTIIIGFIVGLLARAIKPGRQSMGLIMTTVLGIAGALFATYVGRFFGWYGEASAAGFIMSIIGAIVLLWIYGMLAKK